MNVMSRTGERHGCAGLCLRIGGGEQLAVTLGITYIRSGIFTNTPVQMATASLGLGQVEVGCGETFADYDQQGCTMAR